MKIICTSKEKETLKSIFTNYVPCTQCVFNNRCTGTKCTSNLDTLVEWKIVKGITDDEHTTRVQVSTLIKTFAKARRELTSVNLNVIAKLIKDNLSSLNTGLNPNNLDKYADFVDGNKWIKVDELYLRCVKYERDSYNRLIPKETLQADKYNDSEHFKEVKPDE